jgi:DNA-binding NtrC family response regulator
MSARVLLVEDEINMAKTQARILRRRGYVVSTAGNGREALRQLDATPFDIVITDLKMPVMDGMQLLRHMNIEERGCAVIVLTGHGTIESAVEAMQCGAADYLTKPCNPDALLIKVEQLLETRRLRQEVSQLRREVWAYKKFGELIGQSPAMRDIYAVIQAVSTNKSTVVITGESGTGKELVARTIHQKGPLAAQPFVALNCGAMSETLLDSQLFGHRRGAFTGAIADHNGVFQAAHGGTLFLDEIAEIPLALQVKFLRAIQEREVSPLGAGKPVSVDVRIIAASNRELSQAVEDGAFREDLFYRLNVIPIHLPPLRQRSEDIPLLIDHFIAAFSAAYKVEPKTLAPQALAKLQAYAWPGNIRELQNVIERLFALCPGHEIGLGDLPEPIAGLPDAPTPFQTEARLPSLEEMEKSLIAAALDKSQGNKNEAARLLGIDRQRLYRKIEKYGLTVPAGVKGGEMRLRSERHA